MSSASPYYQYHYQQPTGPLPVNIPGKAPHQPYAVRYSRHTSAHRQLSASPPERPESVSSSGAGVFSSASSNYAGSEYESSSGATSVDLLDYMNDRLSQAYNPLPMDKSLARQAQMSGELNAKNRELLALQAQARARLAKTRTNFSEGMKAAREVQRDLEWTQKKVRSLNSRVAQKYPNQYQAASQRYPESVEY